jgi:hypothetical protein
MRGGWVMVVAVLLRCLVPRPAEAASNQITIDEVLGSWQGDDDVQFIELLMQAPGQGQLSDGGGVRGAAELILDGATGSVATRQVFTFTHDVTRTEAGARVLIATRALAGLTGLEPDFVLPPGMLAPRAGRVCYRVNAPQDDPNTVGVVDCVAYGDFTGDNGAFGPPTSITPDDRSLQRIDFTGRNRADWTGVLSPAPETNAGNSLPLRTICGDGEINQGEECDGSALGGKTCASFAYSSGTLRCRQCHFDKSHCTYCGNGVINGSEECDGAALGGKSCASLGFTGGTLACTNHCRLSTDTCDPVFFVPGGGPPGPECLAEWQVTNAAGRPGADGRAALRQRCRDGDAGCDADAVTGTCTFTVSICLDRTDARLKRGSRPCRHAPIASWALLAPATDGADADLAARLLAAVGALGPSSSAEGVVTFAPPLDSSEHCTAPLAIVVPTRGARPGSRLLRSRTAGGRLRDADTLKLVCVP